MAIIGSSEHLTQHDVIQVEEKVTAGYFSGGGVQLLASNITTTSLANNNETYFYGISETSSQTPGPVEFNVAYGNSNGYGGLVEPNTISETKAIYKQFSNHLLAPNEVTGGFFISRNSGLSATPTNAALSEGADTEIYALVARRSNMLDRINKKNWTLILSGSDTQNSGSGTGNDVYPFGQKFLSLTDDSKTQDPTPTIAGDRYNIVSGSDGDIVVEASTKTYGWFYPDHGILLFSGAELSASIPGSGSAKDTPAVFGAHGTGLSDLGGTETGFGDDFRGFGTTTNTNNDYNNAVRFINCLEPEGAKLKYRNEEDQISQQYFCRLRAGQFNFSNNPTFVSGSNNELRQKTMWNNPSVFATTVQLYNGSGDIVAIGRLSKPLKKNFSSEATIKVKLTY
jgi:hypothetical protein